MKINVLQVQSEGKNEFEIKYNDTLQYKAKLPFISIKEPLNLDKLRSINIFDINGNHIYTTDYKYIKSFKEEFIPMKFLITGSQKFNQLVFTSNKNIIKIYYEEKALWDNRYVIEINNKQYFCYSVEDGYIRHFPIYDGEIQIGEALKSNIVIDAKDEYCCYLKDGYESISDGIVALLLYLDRSEYSSSYLVNKSYNVSKIYSYNKANKLYNKEWVKNNFGDEFYRKVDENIKLVKEKFKHPLKTFEEQWNTMSEKNKKLLRFIFIAPWAIFFIVLLIVLIVGVCIFISNSNISQSTITQPTEIKTDKNVNVAIKDYIIEINSSKAGSYFSDSYFNTSFTITHTDGSINNYNVDFADIVLSSENANLKPNFEISDQGNITINNKDYKYYIDTSFKRACKNTRFFCN